MKGFCVLRKQSKPAPSHTRSTAMPVSGDGHGVSVCQHSFLRSGKNLVVKDVNLPSANSHWCKFTIRFSCVSIVPFGRPVVPSAMTVWVPTRQR